MIKKLSIVATALLLSHAVAAAATTQEKRLEFTLAEAPWTLTLLADNFKLAQKKMRDDGLGAYFYLTDEKQDINLSMFIEPVKNCDDSKSCRDFIWKTGNSEWVNPQNVVQTEIGDVSVLEFLLPKFQGMDIRQQNVYAEFVVDGFWVDMHLSKALYKPDDHQLFERIIKAVKFEPKNKLKTGN